MKLLIPIVLILALAACSSTPDPTPAPAIPATAPATAAPLPTATWTATAAPTATNTPSPTDLPSPTPTASPEPSPTATAAVTPAPVDLSAYELPLVVAGVTLRVIGELETTTAGLQDGTLASIEAGGTLMGLQIGLATVAQALDEGGDVAHGERLRANLRTVYGIITRWQDGELSSATVGPDLASARVDAQETVATIMAELRGLGVSQDRIDEFLAELNK